MTSRQTSLNMLPSSYFKRSPDWKKSGEALNSRSVTVGAGRSVPVDSLLGGNDSNRSTPKIYRHQDTDQGTAYLFPYQICVKDAYLKGIR